MKRCGFTNSLPRWKGDRSVSVTGYALGIHSDSGPQRANALCALPPAPTLCSVCSVVLIVRPTVCSVVTFWKAGSVHMQLVALAAAP